MQDQTTSFEHEQFGKVRCIVLNGKLWFVGADIGAALKYTNPQKALRDHVPDKFKLTEQIVLSGQKRRVILIDEAGMWRLVIRSKLPKAEKFTDWPCCEVIPSIRKTGSYSLFTETAPVSASSPDLSVMQAQIDELKSTVATLVDLIKNSQTNAASDNSATQAQIDELKSNFEAVTYAFTETVKHLKKRMTRDERAEKFLTIADRIKELSENQLVERIILIKAANLFVGKKFV